MGKTATRARWAAAQDVLDRTPVGEEKQEGGLICSRCSEVKCPSAWKLGVPHVSMVYLGQMFIRRETGVRKEYSWA